MSAEVQLARQYGEPCWCHGKTEAELAAPYALFAFSLPVIVLIAGLISMVFR